MATLINKSNYATLLYESSQGRAGTPDGNVYFDMANDTIELIGDDELATMIITDTNHPNYTDGTTPVNNELNNLTGIDLRGLYNFENERRQNNENLREFLRASKGTYRFAGAFDFVNGCTLDNTVLADGSTDRNKIRGSGCIEFAGTGNGQTDVNRIYHGVNSLVDIQATTQARYALVENTLEATLQAATFSNFQRLGDINEMVQVYGSIDFGDTAADDFAGGGDATSVGPVSITYTASTRNINATGHGFNVGEIVEITGTTNNNGYVTVESVTDANNFVVLQALVDETVSSTLTEVGFDYTQLQLVVRVRSWQYNPGETTSVATGISEFSGFSAGYGVGESQNPANIYPFGNVTGFTNVDGSAEPAESIIAGVGTYQLPADRDWTTDYLVSVGSVLTVSGYVDTDNNGTKTVTAISTTATTNDTITVSESTGMSAETVSATVAAVQQSPFTGMTLQEELSAVDRQSESFNEAGVANFTWTLLNTVPGSAQECAAYLDAQSLLSTDIDENAGTYIGQKGRVFYNRDAAGLIVTVSNESKGLFIDNLSVSEQQNVILTDDTAATRTYPFFPEVRITVGTAAAADPNCWYHVFYDEGTDVHDTATAFTVTDSSAAAVKGNVATDAVGGVISFAYAYDTNSENGITAGTDKDIIVLVEGNGGVAQAIQAGIITRDTTVPITCTPPADPNA